MWCPVHFVLLKVKEGRDSGHPPLTAPILGINEPGLHGIFLAITSSSQLLYPSHPKIIIFFYCFTELDNYSRVIMGILVFHLLNHILLSKLWHDSLKYTSVFQRKKLSKGRRLCQVVRRNIASENSQGVWQLGLSLFRSLTTLKIQQKLLDSVHQKNVHVNILAVQFQVVHKATITISRLRMLGQLIHWVQ